MQNVSNQSAMAAIKGSSEYPDVTGYAAFVPCGRGTMVSLSVYGLPKGTVCGCKTFAVHIHEGGSCTGSQTDPFADVKAHYNPNNCPHPCHAGDLPPIFSESGESRSAFITNRFTPSDIIGRTIIIHESPDDLHTQPSGNAGKKIACGRIIPL